MIIRNVQLHLSNECYVYSFTFEVLNVFEIFLFTATSNPKSYIYAPTLPLMYSPLSPYSVN